MISPGHRTTSISFPIRLPPEAITIVAIALVVLAATASRSIVSFADSRGHANAAMTYQPRFAVIPSVRRSGAANQSLSLNAGHDFITAHTGPSAIVEPLEQSKVAPLSMASADFDEDGTPDLVTGYAYNTLGIVSLYRGNPDTIYPNAPDAQARRATGQFSNTPFLSPAQGFDLPIRPEFLGAGDFDADGHWDLLVANREAERLLLLAGDGRGNLRASAQIRVPGRITALTTGEINRRDGLADIVIGLSGEAGAQVLVFEGPDGAFKSTPESFELPAAVTSLALGQLDDHYTVDLAVAAGDELHIVYGRDRKLSLDEGQRSSVLAARRAKRAFDSDVGSLALGDFAGSSRTDVALLLKNGAIRLLEHVETVELKSQNAPAEKLRADLSSWRSQKIESAAQNGSGELIRVLLSSATKDDLMIRDQAGRELRVLTQDVTKAGQSEAQREVTTFALDSAPAAVLPMRLDPDALHDLVILREGATTPVIVRSAQGRVSQPEEIALTSFSNSAAISNSSGGFAQPPRMASPYPSTINVSGLTGSIDKLRVRLHGVSFGSFDQDMDLLLVGPSGQKMLLMSDVNATCVISNQTLTFDDDATTELEGFNCTSGTYRPKDNPPADTFAAPAPAGPYQTSLASFNGSDPNGTWSLYMVDDAAGFGGSQTIAAGWTLFFGPDSPSNFVVTNTNTSGAGSLNQAVLDANDHLGVDNITFNIAGPGPYSISPSLLSVTDPVTIDATTQPGFAGQPIVELQGGFFFIEGGRTTIRGFVMNQTSGTNILIRNNGNNVIEGNYLGTNLSGLAAGGPQGGNGIEIDTANNLIGGTTTPARNVIGNKTHGIMFATFNDDPSPNDDASNNLVQGNYIGVNANGTALIPITHAGVTSRSAPGSPNNTIGGTTAGARNIISAGTSPSGIDLVYSGSHGYLIQGNFIGTDPTGTHSFGSGFNSGNSIGIGIEGGAHDNLIGGTTPAARNLISGNGFAGVFLRDSATNNNLIQGNFIGTDLIGTQAIASLVGVRMIFDASLNTIGGAVAGTRNIISGNRVAGLQFGEPTRGGALNNVVQANFIGTDVSGDLPLGNGTSPFFNDAGIIIPANSRGDRIIENRIAYNKGHGIRITNVTGGDIDSIEIEISDNLIYGNQGLGIDLGPSGVTANDPQDADGGPNLLQNFPVLTSFAPAAAVVGDRHAPEERSQPDRTDVTVNVNGTLNSSPNQTFTVHWYFSADTECTSNQQGTRPLALGRVPNVTTDANGNASFSFPFDFPAGVTSGLINCTAKDSQGNTSEFSACFPLSTASPTPSPSPSPSPATVHFSAANYNIAEGGTSVTTTVTRSGNPAGVVTVDFAASDGSATQNQDYVVTSGTLSFAAAETSRTFTVLIVDDAFVEGNQTLNLVLSNATGATLAAPSMATITIIENDSAGSTIPAPKRFAAMLDGAQETPANNSTAKGTGYVLLNQSETAASVSLQFQNLGSAQISAHIHGPGAVGVMAPILFTLPTTNPVTNHQINPPAQQVADLKAGLHYLNVHSTNFVNGEIRGQLRWNPTLDENFFVRQQYLDFLSRDGDPGGFNFWVNQVGSCQADAQCLHDRTITTSNAFFFEPEFQQTAGYVFRAYRAAFGNNQPFPNPDGSNATEANKLIDYGAFVADRARVVGGADLAIAQQAFANQFVARSAFVTKYATATTSAQFVDAILANIQNADNVNLTGQRQALIDQYTSAGGGNLGRARVLYRLADDNAQNPINNQAFINAEYNRQFALTLYFGYLRRNPDIGGFLFWQSQINLAPLRDVPKQNALVCSFLSAAEYQLRFGPDAPRSNAECPQ